MDRPRFYHGLRIAWTAVCGILCVLLIASWMRSYRTFDYLYFPLFGSRSFGVDVQVGNVMVIIHRTYSMDWQAGTTPSPYVGTDVVYTVNEPTWGFHYSLRLEDLSVAMPHWFLILLSLSLSAIPWMRWRFSLRTLLIATTLVAVALGLVVWGMR